MRNFLSVSRTAAACLLVSVCGLAATSTVRADNYVLNVFTYQGELSMNGQPVNGVYDVAVRIYDSMLGNQVVAVPLLFPNVQFVDGLFSIDIAVEPETMNGGERMIEFEVRSPGQPTGTVLAPRQRVRSAPYADFSYKTRGLNVSSSGNFAAVGRTSAITGAERFGVHADTADFGGMYVSTDEGGKPFYGYATDGAPRAWHYYDSSTDQWRVNVNSANRFSINKLGSATFGDPASQTALRITPGADEVRIWRETAGSSVSLIDIGSRFNFKIYNVGINENEPAARLSVTESGNVAAVFNRTGSDGAVVVINNDGVAAGSISVSGSTVSYNAFTGSHFACTDDAGLDRGMLLSMTGKNVRMNNAADGESVHGVHAAQVANDPAILGAYNGLHDEGKPASAANPILAMAVGNGDIWVVDDGRGNLKPGDLLISSDTRGCAMLDDAKRFASGNVVARVAEGCDWSSVQPDADGKKRAKVAVLFDRFVRGGDAAALGERLDNQSRELAELRQELARLKHAN